MWKENTSNRAPFSVDRAPGSDPPPDEIRRQLDNILKSRRFNRSQRCTGFLRYVVESPGGGAAARFPRDPGPPRIELAVFW